MAVSDGIYGTMLDDQYDTTQSGMDCDSDVFSDILVTDTEAPDFDLDKLLASVDDNEVSGTGYVAGGATKGSITSAVASGFWTIDGADASWTSATIASIEARILLCDLPDQAMCMSDFGSTLGVTAGTFAITEDALGVMRVDYTP